MTATNSGPLTVHESSLRARWEEAVDRCRDKLKPRERDKVLQFQTPDDVEKELRQFQQTHSNTTSRRAIMEIYPCLRMINDLFVFLLVEPPINLEAALFWGLLHLVLMNVVASTQALQKMVDILERTRKMLSHLKQAANSLSETEESKTSMVDMLVALIELWVEVNKEFRIGREDPLLAQVLPNVETAFVKAQKRMDRALEDVERHASFARLISHSGMSGFSSSSLIDDEDDSLFPCALLPRPPPLFYGRKEELESMETHLAPKRSFDASRTAVLWGMGGSGKSSSAQQYADMYMADKSYEAVFWVRGETKAGMEESFIEIAQRLGMYTKAKSGDKDFIIIQVNRWLAKTKRKWLIVYDNVEDLRLLNEFLPQGRGHILITTRYRWLATKVGGHPLKIEIKPFDDDHSQEMFKEICRYYDPDFDRSSEEAEMTTLLERLGGLALGIEQIAAYVTDNELSISEFIEEYDQASKRIHANPNSGTGQSLATVWEVQFQRIHDTPAAKVLGALSLLSPDSVPMNILIPDDPQKTGLDSVDTITHDEINEAVDTLVRLALIKRSGRNLSLHRLVQSAFLERNFPTASRTTQALFDAVAKLVDQHFPLSSPGSLWGKWDICAKYLPHSLHLAKYYQSQSGRLTASETTLTLWKNSAWYQYEANEYLDCLKLIDIATKACKDKKSLLYAYFCSHAACAHYELHEIEKGKEKVLLAISIRKAKLDPDHLDYINAIANNALLNLSSRQYEEAERLFEECRKVRERVQADYATATRLLLGITCCLMDKLDRAKHHLDITETALKGGGDESLWVKSVLLYWQGNLYLKWRQTRQAKEAFEASRKIIAGLVPTSIAAAALEYKLGIIDLEDEHIQSAIDHFTVAVEYARRRNIGGEIARVLRAKSLAVEKLQSPSDEQLEEARYAMHEAEKLRRTYFSDEEMMQIGEDVTYNHAIICGQRR